MDTKTCNLKKTWNKFPENEKPPCSLNTYVEIKKNQNI